MFDATPKIGAVFERSLMFKTSDGAELVGRLFRPAGDARAAVVLNSATGVPQGYYAHFARWLAAERDMACLTYDYRDVGRSWSGPLRQSKADMVDWGVTDQVAARRAMRREVPHAPLWVMGHSLGAMLLPNQPETEDIARVIAVASGFVHHSDHPWPYRATALAFWFALGPPATCLAGYLPGKRLTLGEDLPAGVFWQWRRWCTSREFYAADIGDRLPPAHWNARAAVRLVTFTDDALAPVECTGRLAQAFGPQAVQVEIDPERYGLISVGHTGMFLRRNSALWPSLIAD